jgi:hypothetical protein
VRLPHCVCCSHAAPAQEPSDDENDMLDLAFGLTQTSRLGCQVVAGKELDGLVVRLPSVWHRVLQCLQARARRRRAVLLALLRLFTFLLVRAGDTQLCG